MKETKLQKEISWLYILLSGLQAQVTKAVQQLAAIDELVAKQAKRKKRKK